MRRALVLLLALAACAPAASSSSPPSPPAELVFIPGPAVRAVETRDGSVVATLPVGAFDAVLSGGGDVAEAYVVGEGVHRIRPGRPFRDDRVADATGAAPYQVALVAAPGLTSFVGQKTVLVTLSADGTLAGYQAGTRIWTHAVPEARELRRIDDLAAVRTGSDWSLLVPESGALAPLVSGCPQGPLAAIDGLAVVPCAADHAISFAGLPPGAPYVLRAAGGRVTVLAWPDGHWASLRAGETRHAVPPGPGGGRPALSEDGTRLYWPASYPPATAMASSRDGNFLYAVGGGRLRVFATGSRQPLRDFALDAADVSLVSGG